MWAFQDSMGWWMVFGGMMSMAFLAAFVGLVVWAIAKFNQGSASKGGEKETPIRIAESRLARGDITVEQFDEIRGVIQEVESSSDGR